MTVREPFAAYPLTKMGNASETFILVSRISKENDFLMGIIYAVFGVLSMLGNGTLLFVAYRKKSSLKPAEFFVVNLAISDLGMTTTLFPLAIPSAFYHMWLFNKITCTIYAFCGVLFGLCSLTNLTMLSSVCWLKVCCPNQGSKFSSCHSCLLIAGVWCYALIFAVGPLSGWGHHELHCVPVLLLLYRSLYHYLPVLHLHPDDCEGVPTGSAAAHVPQNKITNAHALIIKLSVAVCIGFLTAWSPYAVVSMWAAFGDPETVPPMAFALAAIFAKSSTLYNPIVYLLFKPNFRKSLCRDMAQCRRMFCGCFCGQSSPQKGTCRDPDFKDECNSTRLSNGLPEHHGTCRHCSCPVSSVGRGGHCEGHSPQQTARILKGSKQCEITVSQLSNELQSDFL
ncbi:hypothetical protein WMY93_027321 [Mugilogobius chulae]|uniref:G-protein coupled receptors family 1 profile domain-containing protein n=1 Tax=Mugilogobius chulae TaxID=88201 RepID=A0AAW0MSL7_9GOBI